MEEGDGKGEMGGTLETQAGGRTGEEKRRGELKR